MAIPASSAGTARQVGTLRHGEVGFGHVLFQSVTTVAPAAGIATALPAAAAYAGGSTTLAILLATVAMLCVAWSLGQMAGEFPSAGGLSTYAGAGLGAPVGFLVGWAMLLAYASIPLYFFGYLGLICVSEVQSVWSGFPSGMWGVFAVVSALLVWIMLERGIKFSTRAGIILGSFEILVFAILSITLIVHAGGHNSVGPLTPSNGNPKGMSTIVTAGIYCVLAFIGFEAAAPIGEETRNPRRFIPLAMIIGVCVGAVIYALSYYAVTVYEGPGRMMGLVSQNGGNPWTGLGSQVWGLAAILVTFAILNSLIANMNGAANAVTRMTYALGRIGAIPKTFGTVNERRGTPVVAIRVLMLGTVVLALVLGYVLSGGPLAVFVIFATALTLLVLLAYIAVALSCIVYHARNAANRFSWMRNGVVPALAVIITIPLLLASIGVSFAGLNIAPVTGVAVAGVWLAVGWIVVGVGWCVWLSRSRRDALAGVSRLYVEELSDKRG
jgi:amino acid transporter